MIIKAFEEWRPELKGLEEQLNVMKDIMDKRIQNRFQVVLKPRNLSPGILEEALRAVSLQASGLHLCISDNADVN